MQWIANLLQQLVRWGKRSQLDDIKPTVARSNQLQLSASFAIYDASVCAVAISLTASCVNLMHVELTEVSFSLAPSMARLRNKKVFFFSSVFLSAATSDIYIQFCLPRQRSLRRASGVFPAFLGRSAQFQNVGLHPRSSSWMMQRRCSPATVLTHSASMSEELRFSLFDPSGSRFPLVVLHSYSRVLSQRSFRDPAASLLKLAFHDADTDTDIFARILADTSDTSDFLKLFLWQAERHADILATIFARMSATMSVSVSVSASWNASFTTSVTVYEFGYRYEMSNIAPRCH